MDNKIYNAKVISIIAKTIKVIYLDKEILCHLKGNLKIKSNYKLVPGDIVDLEYINNEYVIIDIKVRKNYLIRPRCANVDYVVIVISVKEPNLNLMMLYKYILFYEYFLNNIVIIFSKTDLLDEYEYKTFLELKNNLISIGYFIFDKNNKEDFNDFLKLIKNHLVCLAGNSGVGKSSLLNKINPDLLLKVQEISKKLNRGKHTTVNNQIFIFNEFQIIDTAGFGSIELFQTPLQLAVSFHDYKDLSVNCKFRNCLHENENNCAIKSYINKNEFLLQRHECYKSCLNQIKNKRS